MLMELDLWRLIFPRVVGDKFLIVYGLNLL